MGVLSRLFVRRPLLANTVSSGVLLAVGDAIQQGIEFRRGVHKEARYNWRRTGRMLVVGLAEGPPHHWWYTGLDRLLPGRTARVVRLKILADQLVAAPLFALTFFVGMDLLEGRTLRDGLQEFRRKFPEVYLFDWCIWPPTQWLNFTYVPERYRVLYVNVVTVVWDVFLSWSKHRDQQAPEGESTTKSALRQHQLKVSALESDKLDSDSERLESDPSHATDSVRTASSQSSTGDCGMVVAIADVATAGRTTDRSNDAGSSEEDFVRTADGTETGQSSVGCAGLSEGPCQDGEGVDERHVQEQAGAAELRRRRDAS